MTTWYQWVEVWHRRVTNAVVELLGRRRLRHLGRVALTGLLLLWLLWGLARVVWSLVGVPSSSVADSPAFLNTPKPSVDRTVRSTVDIDAIAKAPLFGVGAASPEDVLAVEQVAGDVAVGIEQGARETRLALTLHGVIASSDTPRARAIIQHSGDTELYAVGDPLPVPGRVVLVKILERQVVLQNAGVYELLTLFDESSEAMARSEPAASTRVAPSTAGPPSSPVAADVDPMAARALRDRLYRDPQSIAELVTIAPVRVDGMLRGYRVAPGAGAEEFAQLGFKAGDVVTAINGIALDDPSNTLELYAQMRTARQANFDVERDGQRMNLTISLDESR